MVSIFVITRTLPDLIGISGWEIFIGLHLLLAATITVGLCFQDGFAGFLDRATVCLDDDAERPNPAVPGTLRTGTHD